MSKVDDNNLIKLNSATNPRGKIFDIHRLSTHDGPGMRTTVFMKGCSLKCTWCHNPESIQSYSELKWLSHKCIGCGKCFEACEEGALSYVGDNIVIDRDKCTRCMRCAEVCPTGAMQVIGEFRTVDDIFDEIMQDYLFYVNSGGGVTISGGEPLLQGNFVYNLLKKVHDTGIHTAVDTSMQVKDSVIRKIAPYVDLWLVDLKEMDPSLQEGFIGATDEKIRYNIKLLLNLLERTQSTSKIWIRTPLIPTATAREENVKAIGTLINELNNGYIALWELCTFNNLGGDKYQKLNQEWQFDQVPLMTKDEKNSFEAMATSIANGTYEVKVSGLTQ